MTNKLSDAVAMRIDKDPNTPWPVVEIEFRFVRYRLVIDNRENAEKLINLIDMVMRPDEKVSENQPLPHFYKE